MSFSTAELFQSTANSGITHNGKPRHRKKASIIRKGNSVKLDKKNNSKPMNNNRIAHRHKDSSQFVHHVPHNSIKEQYSFYEDLRHLNGNNINNNNNNNNNNNINGNIVNGNGNNNILFQHIEQHQHINNHGHHSNHKHNNSLASNFNHNYHARNNTISQYNLDNSLDIIDGDIPIQSQKQIMQDFFQERVNNHLQQQSSNFIDNVEDNDDDEKKDDIHSQPPPTSNNIISHHSFSGTMREIQIGTPFDETDIIDFNDVEQIEIEDYTDHEEETEIDPMKLIAAKNRLRNNKENGNSFPDTQPITAHINKNKRKRRKHNNTAVIKSPLTPASVIIRDDSDNETYASSNDSEQNDINDNDDNSHRDSQKLSRSSRAGTANNTPLPPTSSNKEHHGTSRANTITNIRAMMAQQTHKQKSSTSLLNKHRHSRSEIPKSMKKKDLFNLYKGNNSDLTKAYFSNLTKAAKTTHQEVEKKARQEMEKKYKPELQKTKLELDEARRRSLKQEEEMNSMKRELEKLKKQQANNTQSNDHHVNQKLREKNLEIQELQSKLKFEKQRNQIQSSNPYKDNSRISNPNILPMTTPNLTNHSHSSISIPPTIPSTAPFGPIPPPSSTLIYSKSSSGHPTSHRLNRRHSARFAIPSRGKLKNRSNGTAVTFRNDTKLSEGMQRLKKRVSTTANKPFISMRDLKKLPEELAKKHKRPLWTDRSMTKSKTFDKDEVKEDFNGNTTKLNGIHNIKSRGIPKKRESLLLPPNNAPLKSRFFDRNQIKRNSWNAGINGDKNSDENTVNERLKNILFAARQHHAKNDQQNKSIAPVPTSSLMAPPPLTTASRSASNLLNYTSKPVSFNQLMSNNNMNTQNNNTNSIELKTQYEDIKSKYEHLMAENQILRKENLQFKDDLKKYKAPTPSTSPTQTANNGNNSTTILPPPVLTKPKAVIERNRRKQKVIPRKRLNQYPKKKMITIDWIPIENNKIKDTQWKRIGDSDIKIPTEFENLFCIKQGIDNDNDKDNKGKGMMDDDYKLEMKLSDSNKSNMGRNSMNKIKFQRKSQKLKHSGISEKRQESVMTILKKIKLSPKHIRQALLNVDETKLTRPILYNLLEIAPNLNEQKYVQNKMNQIQINSFSATTYLSEVEEFFYELSDVNHLELRLQLWIFKTKFKDAIDERYNDLYLLLQALKSIQRSSNLVKILSVILSFGNFMNVDIMDNDNDNDRNSNNNNNKNNGQKYGINGFELESLLTLKNVKSNDDHFSLLSYICKYCKENEKYKDCLKIMSELNFCLEASKINSYDCHQKILLINEELMKFGRSLRKFRKAAVSTTSDNKNNDEINDDNNNNNNNTTNSKPYPYKKIQNDQFEKYMREFARKAQLVCKSLLDLRHECITIAQILSHQYNYNLNEDKIEDFIAVFANFVSDLNRAKNQLENYQYRLRKKQFISQNKQKICTKLSRFLINRPLKDNIHFIMDLDEMEIKQKEKEENKNILSKLIYEHAVLMDQQYDEDENQQIMSYQRIKYLKGLAKSNELPNQLSNNPEAIQKQRRRRRSLSATDIQIGSNMAMTLAEDEEMK